MKLTISKHSFNEAIQNVAKAISTKITIPILSGIKIDATQEGITVTASDTEISIQSFVPLEENGVQIIEIFDTGSVVLPAKFLIEIIKKLPAEKIEIVTKENEMTIRSGSSKVQLVCLDPEEYPSLPQVNQSNMISIQSNVLKNMIRQTAFAVSTSETTPILTGVLWAVNGNVLNMTACDRHRLAKCNSIIESNFNNEIFNHVVISGKILSELKNLLEKIGKNDMVEISVSLNQVLYKFQNTCLYSRIIEGTYPDINKLISQTFQTEVVINSKQLTDAIDRAFLLSREEKTNTVKMIINENKTLEISSSSSELGKVTELIPAEQITGELIKISFNSKYMMDALKALDGDFIRLKFTGPMSPIVIQSEDGSSVLQLILPYRTTN